MLNKLEQTGQKVLALAARFEVADVRFWFRTAILGGGSLRYLNVRTSGAAPVGGRGTILVRDFCNNSHMLVPADRTSHLCADLSRDITA